MERKKKVVDASVIVKLFTNEESSDRAVQLREAHISGEICIVISELTFLEVLNALRFKGGSAEKLVIVSKELRDLQFHVEKLADFVLEKTIAIALEYDVTIYDASYAAVAQIYGAQIVTADKKMARIPNVVMIDRM